MGAALILLFFLGSDTWNVYTKNEEAAQANTDVADQLSQLQARQKALSTEIDALSTERGIEAQVRETYPLAKNGEEVIVLTNPPQAATDTQAQAGSGWWQWFTGLFSW